MLVKQKIHQILVNNSTTLYGQGCYSTILGEFTIYIFAVPYFHWGRVTHICVGKLSTVGSDNGLSPNRRQVIIWTNAGILLIGTLGTNFREISIEIDTLSFRKMHLKMSSAKWRLFRLGLNELTEATFPTLYYKLCCKSDGGAAFVIQSHLLISNSNYTADSWSWSQHQRICALSAKLLC